MSLLEKYHSVVDTQDINDTGNITDTYGPQRQLCIR
jgi:hypothetical protein